MARVLIIGATSAIATEMARRCVARGDSLYLLARNAARLDALSSELGEAVRGTRSADLDRTEANEGHIAEAIEELGGLDIAILAHGLLGDQLGTEADYALAEQVLRTNLLSSISLLIPLANHFEAQSKARSEARGETGSEAGAEGGGHIAVLSSVAGDRGRPRNYTYGAAKAALNVYLQGVRSRLHPLGIQVHTFKLGPVDTPMTVDHEKNASFAQPGDVAKRMLRAIEAGRAEAYVPGYWRPIMFAVRWMPEWLFQRLRFLSGR